MRKMMNRIKDGDSRGFTLLEVLVSMAITVIVMGAVFGLLTQGQQSFQREPQVADLQQSARSALDMVARDVVQAGAGLPVEFPSFTCVDPILGDPTVGDHNPDVLEIVGTMQSSSVVPQDPTALLAFDSGALTGTVGGSQTSLQVGDIVVIYYEYPPGSQQVWWLTYYVLQTTAPGNIPQVLTFGPSHGGATIPAAFSRQNPAEDLSTSFNNVPTLEVIISPVSVVRYATQLNGLDLILQRQVDFGNFVPVGMVDDFQVAYLVGTQPQLEQTNPLCPNPVPGSFALPQNIISGVRITVTARSAQENLQGSTQGASGDYIRKTYSSNISTRNILGALQTGYN